MTNNAAERELHAVAGGLRNWTFAGINEGGDRGAAIYTLIQTAKLNDIDPHAWLTDVLTRLSDHPASALLICYPGLEAPRFIGRRLPPIGSPPGKAAAPVAFTGSVRSSDRYRWPAF